MPRTCHYFFAVLLAKAISLASCFGLAMAEETNSAAPPSYAIATAHSLATQAGANILSGSNGQPAGNAFDAAVAISAALGVIEPSGSGFGGGGFWLLYIAKEDRYVMIDGREKAPLAASRDMYLDDNGEPIKALSKDGPLAAGIPGMPAAITHIAKTYGQLPLAQSLSPAIRYANDGFTMDTALLKRLLFRQSAFNEATRAIYFPNNSSPTIGSIIKQPDLAKTLLRMAATDGKDFYTGKTAQQLVDGVQATGGIWTMNDLAEYHIVERQPIIGDYRGHRVISAAPPSSGGVVIMQTLNILEQLPFKNNDSAQDVHFLTEALRRSYRDRAAYLGDADFVTMPLNKLEHQFYAAGLAVGIQPDQATPSATLPPVTSELSQGTDTTHFSVVDQYGNRVAATLSINLPFGSGFTVPGTGILLNDEMDDFSIKPGTPNAYGLVGNEANAIQPGKRMLSSMSPTFVESPNGDFAVLGTPGGSRIITMVLLGILDYTQGETAQTIVATPRLHHQYLPDELSFEANALTDQQQQALTALGHTLRRMGRTYGNMQVVISRQGKLSAASDPRGIGAAITSTIPSSNSNSPD